MTNPALSRVWGNPAAPTFKKRCVRTVKAGGEAVLVHAELQDIVAAMAEQAGIMEGWERPGKGAEDHPRHYGIAVRPAAPIEDPARYGFDEYEDGWYVFGGTPESAKARTEELEVERMRQRVEAETRHETEWGTGRPGERELGPGDKGDDVQFFQMVYAAPDQTGVFDGWCAGMAKYLQEQWGHPEKTGTVTGDIWKGVLPTAMTYSVGYGDNGHIVRVLQAALLAYDWDYDVLVTGRFDEVTHRAVRRIQAEYGLRVNSDMGAAEWTILLGQPPRNVTP
jgi:hypothetical protein